MRLPTVYQLNQIKYAALFVIISFFLVVISGNIISYFFSKKIYVNNDSYVIKNGFPLFVSEEEYIKFIENYPFDPGVDITVYSVKPTDTLWSLKNRYNISIDTLIAANPHLKGLNLSGVHTVVIPSKNGTLFTFDDYLDVSTMHDMMGDDNRILGKYKPELFRLISPDDIRMVFFENEKPVIVNNDLEKIYSYRTTFTDPLEAGYYTSMYGERINPIFGENLEFHNGVDIATRYGTPIKAARKGIVFYSGWKDGYGNTVVIQHFDGYTTFYAHCSKIDVKKGEWINQGDIIGYVGSTGRSTGSHLHYTVLRHGELLNPFKYLW